MDMTGLMALALREGASDLHLAAGSAPMIRRDGQMQPLGPAALSSDNLHALLAQLMSPQQQEDFARLQDLDFAVAVPGLGRFRVNAFVQVRGPAAVLRLIPDQVPTLASLQLPEVFRRIAESPAGLVLVTGPTGSGKSSTLAALVDHLNRERAVHILTLEDPLEFIHSPLRSQLSQREMGRHSQGFAQALRAALRQDPDVIMLGELRDLETIRLALTAAETGHLVLATLHTASAAKAIDRLVDVFAAQEKALVRTMLADALQAVMAQVLVPRVQGGRVAAHEVLLATPAVRNLIREGKVAQLYSAMQTGAALGMQTLDSSLQGLVRRGVVSLETARANARSPDQV
ncbi:type IV pilus twitching motility protein PilT [Pseudomonas sp. B21-036]|uniref:type IV pilus twitching motility protein PilT n=1 Tax=Pseudomonas TaxID=286 RepID=UPI00215E9549|nr:MULTISPECIES: type IV pilus twitching motility protein PilT [Pseudomonas]UVL51031.1 type IV pilus twitching motility protein PilT [Pseudomonas sp. B21-036]